MEQRRATLQSVLKESERIRFSQEIIAAPESILASACELGLEGVVAYVICRVLRKGAQ